MMNDSLDSVPHAKLHSYLGSFFKMSSMWTIIDIVTFLGAQLACFAEQHSILDDEEFALYLMKWTDDNDNIPQINELRSHSGHSVDIIQTWNWLLWQWSNLKEWYSIKTLMSSWMRPTPMDG